MFPSDLFSSTFQYYISKRKQTFIETIQFQIDASVQIDAIVHNSNDFHEMRSTTNILKDFMYISHTYHTNNNK